MKKVAVLLLAAGLVFGAAHKGAQAADIKVSGEWDFNTEWNNIGFAKEKADDLFHARQRLRTQVDIIASESLKGTVFFEVGDTNWGTAVKAARSERTARSSKSGTRTWIGLCPRRICASAWACSRSACRTS